ncbi:hypothetical protein ACO0LM_21170 [Undibacterium sp. Di26W]|uniref:hypothetical protein n=1 Tax=Undibacterium sp. Di26W TaxID=3413035 RepID=UPI003BEF8511
MAAYNFQLNYNAHKQCVGQYINDLPPAGDNGCAIFVAGDTITYSYVFVEHGYTQPPSTTAISNSVVNAYPVTQNGNFDDPFVNGTSIANNGYQVALNSTSNPGFTVTISSSYSAGDPSHRFTFVGSFTAIVYGSPMSFTWDPECDVGTGA